MFKTLIVLFKVQSKKEPLLHFLFSTGCCCLGNTRCLIKVFPWCLFSLRFALAKTLSYGHKGDNCKSDWFRLKRAHLMHLMSAY